MSDIARSALLLPGQGAQYVGMGSDLANEFGAVRELYERADELLGHPLSEICWNGPEDVLRRTENAQPAILLHSYAVWLALPEPVRQGIRVAAGHSLGEFTAYLCAGALSFDEALRIVRLRGELMAAAGRERPGAMSAVLGLDEAVVAARCAATPGTVVPANFNAPGQIVISGDVEAVALAGESLQQEGARRVIPLNVSGAFHSPLMDGARAGLEEALAEATIVDPSFPVVANVSAEPVSDAGRARELLVSQLTGAVRWADGIESIRRLGAERFLEIGPGSVLLGLLRRIDRGLEGQSVADLEGLHAVTAR